MVVFNTPGANANSVKELVLAALLLSSRDILGGVRSSCTYVGAPSLKQLSKCTTFVRVNNQYNDTFGKI